MMMEPGQAGMLEVFAVCCQLWRRKSNFHQKQREYKTGYNDFVVV
jgi:hypothetical protein